MTILYFALTHRNRTIALAQMEASDLSPDVCAMFARNVCDHMRLPEIEAERGGRTDSVRRLDLVWSFDRGDLLARIPPAVLTPAGRLRAHSKHASTREAVDLTRDLQERIARFGESYVTRASQLADERSAAAVLRATRDLRAEAEAAHDILRQQATTIANGLEALAAETDVHGGVNAQGVRELATAARAMASGQPLSLGGLTDRWGVMLTREAWREICGYVVCDKKINAIKALRTAAPSLGLKEAKDWVKGHWAKLLTEGRRMSGEITQPEYVIELIGPAGSGKGVLEDAARKSLERAGVDRDRFKITTEQCEAYTRGPTTEVYRRDPLRFASMSYPARNRERVYAILHFRDPAGPKTTIAADLQTCAERGDLALVIFTR